MAFQIGRGLFQLDFQDHHAVLGVPVDAEAKDIRKSYLKIARRLHPDSHASDSKTDKAQASELLSKLVNPSWEKLSQEKERVEYALLLKLKGQQAIKQQDTIQLSDRAVQLLTVSNIDQFYRSTLKQLAEEQYQDLTKVLDITGEISELNLAYLMRKESQGQLHLTETKKPTYATSQTPSPVTGHPTTGMPATPKTGQPIPSSARPEPLVMQYYRRAEGYITRNNYPQAILELRDALQIEPQNSQCHALLGVVYLRQNQPTMAKIHFNKALEKDPKNAIALEGKRRLAKIQSTTTGKSTTPPPPAQKPDKPGGGLFGLFGGKKK